MCASRILSRLFNPEVWLQIFDHTFRRGEVTTSIRYQYKIKNILADKKHCVKYEID